MQSLTAQFGSSDALNRVIQQFQDLRALKSARNMMYFLHGHPNRKSSGRPQYDPGGQIYVGHPQRVRANLLKICPGASVAMQQAALLHDVVEDCEHFKGILNPSYFKCLGYSQETIDLIWAVTKPDGDERSYDEVISDLIATGNQGAILVKIADHMDNIHPQRIDNLRKLNPIMSDELRNKYQKSIRRLSVAAGINPDFVLNLVDNSPRLVMKEPVLN